MVNNFNLSIHIPVYNSEKTIERCVNSILRQSYKDFDLYIYNDCSTDNTLKILNEMNYEKKFKIISNPSNLGHCGNFNNILNKVDTEYFAIFHGDDEYNQDIVKEEFSFLKREDISAVFTNGQMNIGSVIKQIIPNTVFNKKKNIYNFEEIFDVVLKHFNVLICSSAMFDTNIIKGVGNFDKKFGMSIDLEMWFRLLKKKPIGILNKNLLTVYLKTSVSYLEFKKKTPNDFFLVMDKIINERYQNKLTKKQHIYYEILKMRDCSRILFNLFSTGETNQIKENLKYIKPFFIIKNLFKSKKCVVILFTYFAIVLFLKFKLIKIPKIILEYIYKRVS